MVDLDKKSRSQVAEKCIKLLASLSDTPLDISHYNAMLKVFHENETKVSVSEQLSIIEQQDLTPNRVTYQHCVALLCQQGDIAGNQPIREFILTNQSPVLCIILTNHTSLLSQEPQQYCST